MRGFGGPKMEGFGGSKNLCINELIPPLKKNREHSVLFYRLKVGSKWKKKKVSIPFCF